MRPASFAQAPVKNHVINCARGPTDLAHVPKQIGGVTSVRRREGVVRLADSVHRPARVLPKIT